MPSTFIVILITIVTLNQTTQNNCWGRLPITFQLLKTQLYWDSGDLPGGIYLRTSPLPDMIAWKFLQKYLPLLNSLPLYFFLFQKSVKADSVEIWNTEILLISQICFFSHRRGDRSARKLLDYQRYRLQSRNEMHTSSTYRSWCDQMKSSVGRNYVSEIIRNWCIIWALMTTRLKSIHISHASYQDNRLSAEFKVREQHTAD